MTSLTKILILFIAVVIIGEVVDMHPDSNRSDAGIDELSDRLARLKLPVADYTDIDTWMMWLLRTRLESPQTSPPVETTTSKFVANQHPGWRIRRQGLVKTRGTDGGLGCHSSFDIYCGGVQPITILKIIAWIHRQLGIKLMNRIRNGDVPKEFSLPRPDIFIQV